MLGSFRAWLLSRGTHQYTARLAKYHEMLAVAFGGESARPGGAELTVPFRV